MVRKPKGSGSGTGAFFESVSGPRQDDKGTKTVLVEANAPKDEKELELEKLVFGDEAGFQEGLKDYNERNGDDLPSDEEQLSQGENGGISSDEEGLEGMADADLFYVDTGDNDNSEQQLVRPHEDDKEPVDQDPPAWVDSDDERMAVSLATKSQLRKLRTFEGEDIISGKEYTKRLQQQFERLYPVPEWANTRESGHRKKRRRTSESGSSSDDIEGDEMSLDEGEISAQPLAKLLQSTDSLTATYDTSEARKKLRPEIIDIQRTKDVSGTQPSAIHSLSFHPKHPILLSSGPSSLMTLHHISPSSTTPNPVLTKLAIPRLAIETSAIHAGGQHVYIGARRRYFHIWDLDQGRVARVTRIYGHADEQRTCERFKLSPCGRYMALVGSARKGGGAVNILDARTGQWVCQARVEGRGGVADLAWWRDGNGLVVLGKGGEAIEYSMDEKRVLARWQDEGAVGTTVVALGGEASSGLGGDRWIAVGG